jgi:hypothetical protein
VEAEGKMAASGSKEALPRFLSVMAIINWKAFTHSEE